jgi:hypothetical protein
MSNVLLEVLALHGRQLGGARAHDVVRRRDVRVLCTVTQQISLNCSYVEGTFNKGFDCLLRAGATDLSSFIRDCSI